jgi:hypothetical protein
MREVQRKILRVRATVGFCSTTSTAATGRGAKFETEHSERFLAGLDEEFAEEYFAETGHVKRMTVNFDTRAIRFDTFDDRAKENSVYVRRLEDVIRAERVLGYCPEIAAFLKGLFCGLEGQQVVKEGVIQFDLNGTASNTKIFKFAANPRDIAFLLARLMFRIEARDDAIDGEHIEHVQIFEDSGCERVVRIVVGLVTAGDVRIAFFERDEITEFECFDTRVAMAAGDGQCTLRLNVDLMMKRPSEICTKRVSTSMEMERTGRLRGHTYHLLNVTTEGLMLLNLCRKCNCKWKLAGSSRCACGLIRYYELVFTFPEAGRNGKDDAFLRAFGGDAGLDERLSG